MEGQNFIGIGSIKPSVKNLVVGFALIWGLLLTGCQKGTDFHIKDLAKTNINSVSEIHKAQANELLKELTQKLYKKNPAELKKIPNQTIESRLDQIFMCPISKRYEELEYKESTDAILLGFEPSYKGDRIFALMFGLYTMIHKSYNSKCELFMLDFLNEQSLYNSARNIEIMVWRLKTRKKENGHPLILTNSFDGDVKNLSYERLFGKLISLQDTMALIVSKRSGRLIKESVLFAGMAFLPIGF